MQTCSIFRREVSPRHSNFFLTLIHQRHVTMHELGQRGWSLSISFHSVFSSKGPLSFWHINALILKIFQWYWKHTCYNSEFHLNLQKWNPEKNYLVLWQSRKWQYDSGSLLEILYFSIIKESLRDNVQPYLLEERLPRLLIKNNFTISLGVKIH